MAQVEAVRPLEVNAPGTSELKISNRGSNSIYYGDNAQVSSTNKTGTLAVGESLTIKGPNPVWLRAEAVPAIVDFQEKEPGAGATSTFVEGTTFLRASGGDDSTLLQALITPDCDILLGPGTFLFKSAAIQLPRNATGIRIKGSGKGVTTIQLSTLAPRAFDCPPIADYDTYKNIEVSDLTVDCNNIAPAFNNHVVLGNLINGDWSKRANIEHVRVRRVNTINVPTGASVSRQNVSFGSKHAAEGETQTKLLDIADEDCNFQGGNVGVAVLGSGGSTSVNVFCDELRSTRLTHDTLSVPTAATRTDAHIQYGGRGFGGTDEIVGLRGTSSGDVGIECDAMTVDIRDDCIITDSRNAAFFARNFAKPLRPNIQICEHRNCHSRIVNLNPDAGTYKAAGFQLSHPSTPNPKFGTMLLDGCTSDSKATNLGALGSGILVEGPATRLVTKNYQYNQDEVAYTLGENINAGPIYIKPSGEDSESSASPFTWVNIAGKINVSGAITQSGHTFNYRAAWVDMVASTDVTFDGGAGPALEFLTALTGTSNETTYHVFVGPSTALSPLPKARGAFRFRVSKFEGGDTKPFGAYVQDWQGAASPFLELKSQLTFLDCDLTALPSGSSGKEVYGKTQIENKSSGQFMVLYPGIRYANGGERAEDAQLGEGTAANVTFSNRKGVPFQVWLSGAAASKVNKTEWARRTDVSLKEIVTTSPVFILAPGDNIKWTFSESALYKILGIPLWP